MPRNRLPPQETELYSLPALLTFAEARLLTGQRIDTDDWHRLLGAGADAETLHDLVRRGDRPSLGSFGELTRKLHRVNDPQHRTLRDVMKRALKDGMLEPHVHVLRLLCTAEVPSQGQSGNAVVDSQVLCDLIEELYFDPEQPRPTAEVGIAYRGVEELYRNRKKLTVVGLDAVKALRPRLKQKTHETQTRLKVVAQEFVQNLRLMLPITGLPTAAQGCW